MVLLAENIRSVALSRGLVRIETVARNAQGEETKTGELVVPAQQYGAIVTALQRSGDQLNQRLQGGNQEQQAEEAAEGQNGAGA